MVDLVAVAFGFSEEQEELRSSVRRFFADKSPESEVRRLMATDEGFDPGVWRQMGGQLGLQALGVPQAYGGMGCSLVEQAIVLEEMGRALVCVPYLGSAVLAVAALVASGDRRAMERWLPGVASGETIATLAIAEDAGRWDLGSISLAAMPEGDGWRLDGTKSFVLDGCAAGLVLVVARTPGGAGLFAVDITDGDVPGLSRTPLQTMDQTRKLARLELAATPASLIGELGASGPALSTALDHAAVALAAEQVGGAQHCLDSAVDYAKTRVQFGRPIGSFQAVKHKCADLLVEVESARSAAYYGAWAATESPGELPVVARLAKSYCSEAYLHAASENIQIHGGVGFTWEHDAHLYFKRATASSLLFGDPAFHRDQLAELIGV